MVQAGGVILTLRSVGRNRPQAVALGATHARGVLRRLGRVALWVIGGFTVGSVLLVALYRYVPPPGTPLMLLRRVEGYGIHKSWSSFDHLSANLVRAVIASEDTRFCSHHGFDWNAIEVAWNRYQRKPGRLLGASTNSMQTAKNVFLWPGRDWVRKGFESFYGVDRACMEQAADNGNLSQCGGMGAGHLRRRSGRRALFS